MSNTSLILLDDTNTEVSVTGEPVRADGWWGFTEGKNTVSIHVQNFTGWVRIDGTLASQPTEEDWFPIWLKTTTPYLEYKDSTVSEAFTFEGNFTFVRAVMDRSYMNPQPSTDEEVEALGKVRKVLLNH